MHIAPKYTFILTTVIFAVVLGVTSVGAFTGPGSPGGVGSGAVSSDASNNITVGSDTPISTTKLSVVATSTSASNYAFQVFQPDLTSIFYVRNDGKVSIPGTLETGGFTGTISSGNVSSGEFGANTGGGNYTFPASVDINNKVRIAGSLGLVGTSPYALSLQNNGVSNWIEVLNNGGTGKGIFFGVSGNDFHQWNYQGGSILFYTNPAASTGTERLRIANNGDVSIGTITGGYKLNVAGTGNFSSAVTVPDAAYAAGWDGSLEVPTKNAIYDKIEAGGGTVLADDVSSGEFGANTGGGNYSFPGTLSVPDGAQSERFGLSTTAPGTASLALGWGAVVAGNYSVAVGNLAHTSCTGNCYGITVGRSAEASAAGGPIAIGYSSLASGSGATAVGYNADASGSYSTAYGYGTDVNGAYAIAIGYNAATASTHNITIGSLSDATGYLSMAHGYAAQATATGAHAFGYSTEASANYAQAIGYDSNALGSYSVALGYRAKAFGTSDIVVGRDAAFYATASAGANVAIGYRALFGTPTAADIGTRNIAIGQYAMHVRNAGGNDNIGIGYYALQKNVDGNYNIGIGRETGKQNINGDNNTFLGYRAGYNNTGSSNVFIGTNAGYSETGSNLLYIDNSNTATPLIWGDFSADLARINGDLEVDDDAYAAGWDGSLEVATKNALYDKIETLGGGGTISAGSVSSGDFGSSTGGGNYSFPASLGVGIASPTSKLHVEDIGSIDFLIEADSNNSGESDVPTITLEGDGGATGLIIGLEGTGGTAFTGALANTSYLENIYAPTGIQFATANTARLIIEQTGDVGIGTTNPSSKLHVVGTGNFTGDVSIPDEVYGAGWNGSLEVPTKNAIYDKIETIGGGGGAPYAAADVSSGSFGANTGGGNYTFPADLIVTSETRGANGTAAAPSFAFSSDTNTGLYRVTTDTLGLSTAGTERIRVGSTGLVGIGTATLSQSLNIARTGATQNRILMSSGTGITGINFLSNGLNWYIDHRGSGGSNNLAIWSNAAERLTIEQAGDVGIGQSNPAYKLDVSGTGRFTGDVIVPDEVYGAGWNGSLEVPTKNAIYDKIETIGGGGGAPYAAADVSSGSFGANTGGGNYTFPADLIVTSEIRGANGTAAAPSFAFSSDTNTGIYRAAADALAFTTGGSHRVRIDSAGDFGIGTTNPTSKLHVVGTGNITGTLAVGGTLTVGSGTGKINVGTVDPIYEIDGEKFATYMAGMIGVKEETSDVLEVRCKNRVCEHEIDFSKERRGSDLWLFAKAVDIEKHMKRMTVLLTPAFEGGVSYRKEGNDKIIIIGKPKMNQRSVEISYRLTAPRFDADQWGNYNHDEGVRGFIINH